MGNTLKLDTSGFTEMLKKLDGLGGDVKKAVTIALQQAAETVTEDTLEGLQPQNLPAGGMYSTGRTKETVVRDPRVTWEGMVGSIPVGFDFAKPGAGGYLITGTPRMRPAPKLHAMYSESKYMQRIQDDIGDVIADFVIEKMEGKK